MTTFLQNLTAKMAARSGVVLVRDEDEYRLETKCLQAAIQMGYGLWKWSVSGGMECVRPATPETTPSKSDRENLATMREPAALLTECKGWKWGPAVLLAFDVVSFMNRAPMGPMMARQIRDITGAQQDSADDKARVQLVICDQEDPQIPCGVQRLTLELPDRAEMGKILDAVIEVLPTDDAQAEATDNRERILNGLAGLPAFQAENALSESRVRRGGRIDPELIREYKKQMVSAKGLTVVDPDPRGFNSIGGLEPFKTWINMIAPAFDPDLAAEYDIDPPRGALAFGLPGCAKSAVVKAVAQELGFTLLRVDMGATRGKFQGDSEAGWENVVKTAEAVAPCILHIDEAEKSLAGGTGSGDADGGTGGRILQSMLTWMQERTAPVFVYMTANRPETLPPELLRAGRLDAQWWFDLPTDAERAGIVEVFKAKFRKAAGVDTAKIVAASDGNNGAEIETAFRESLLAALQGRREVETADVLDKLQGMPRVGETFEMSDELKKLKASARKANNPAVMLDVDPDNPVRRVRRLG